MHWPQTSVVDVAAGCPLAGKLRTTALLLVGRGKHDLRVSWSVVYRVHELRATSSI